MDGAVTAPPISRSTSTTRRIDVADIEALKKSARTILWAAGVTWGPNRLARLCIRFITEVRGQGWDFFDFITTEIALSAERKAWLRDDPEIQRVIAYADPTGEAAASNVDRSRGTIEERINLALQWS